MPTRKSQSLRQHLNVAFFVVLSTVTFASHSMGQAPATPRSAQTSGHGRFLGTRSCAAVACHGDAEAPGIAGQEFIYWLEHDPHGSAGHSLHSELGRRITKALGIRQGDRGYQNCQACHDPYINEPTAKTPARISEAVGCEACHGPSERWVADHYRPDWRQRSAQEKQQCDMLDTQNLVTRARLCAKCHVGATDREVNHDLIAAGHPPLKFEFAAYHEMLPKHWDAHGERLQSSDFELLLWGYGQLAGAEAALSVLEARASRATFRQTLARDQINGALPKPSNAKSSRGTHGTEFPHFAWPELAEYNCFSCHQDLIEPSWRQRRGYPGRLGMADWQTWYFSLPLDPTLQALGMTATVDARIALLRELMQAGYSVDPQAAAITAREAKDRISAALDRAPPRAKSVEQSLLTDALRLRSAQEGFVRNWDTAAQVYLSLFALYRNHQTGHMPVGTENVRKSLAFPDAYDSPLDFGRDSTTDGGKIDRQLNAFLREIMSNSAR